MAANLCPSCGGQHRAGSQFCSTCGVRLPGGAPSPPGPSASPSSDSEARQVDLGIGAQIGLSLIVSLALSRVGWTVLGLPAHLIDVAIPDANCASLTPGTPQMYACSAAVGLVAVLGPLIIVAVAFVFRKQLGQAMRASSGALPSRFRFLAAPTVATGLFTMAYAEIHWNTAAESGLVPQRYFPAVAGLFLLVATKLGPQFTPRLSAVFDIRDQIPTALRLPLALLFPLLFSLVITYQDSVTQTALKEQLVILLSLASTYLAFIPRDGNVSDALKRIP